MHSYEGYDTPLGRLAHARRRGARPGEPADGAAGARARARRDRRARRAARAARDLRGPSPLRARRQLRPRDARPRSCGNRRAAVGPEAADSDETRARARRLAAGLAPLLAASCATAPDSGTLGGAAYDVQPDVAEVEVADSLDLAMQSYRRYLDKTPTSAMTPEAMRRLADLQLEKEFGIIGGPPAGRWVEMAAPEAGAAPGEIGAAAAATQAAAASGGPASTPSRRSPTRSRRGVRRRVRAPHDRRDRVRADRVRPAVRSGGRCAVRAARSDRDLRAPAHRVPELRAPRSGALPNGARLRRARSDRRGDGRHAAPRRRVRLLALQRRGAVPPRRVLLHAPQVPRRGSRLPSDRRSQGALGVPTSSRSTSSAGRSTSRTPTTRR